MNLGASINLQPMRVAVHPKSPNLSANCGQVTIGHHVDAMHQAPVMNIFVTGQLWWQIGL
eukprot:scaffold26323_cov34-Cyclotella_meneghiniana.AAC.1